MLRRYWPDVLIACLIFAICPFHRLPALHLAGQAVHSHPHWRRGPPRQPDERYPRRCWRRTTLRRPTHLGVGLWTSNVLPPGLCLRRVPLCLLSHLLVPNRYRRSLYAQRLHACADNARPALVGASRGAGQEEPTGGPTVVAQVSAFVEIASEELAYVLP